MNRPNKRNLRKKNQLKCRYVIIIFICSFDKIEFFQLISIDHSLAAMITALLIPGSFQSEILISHWC